MRKQKVLFLCTQNSARSQMAEAFLTPRRGTLRGYSTGCRVTDEVHPYAVHVMDEIGIDMSEQYPKDLKTYMGKMGFNYSIIVCARAEMDCSKTFPGVGTRLSWVFDDPRGENVPEEEMLDRFREVQDEIEQKLLNWLDHPEEELAKLRAERERERQERLRASYRKARRHNTYASSERYTGSARLAYA